MVVGTLPVTFCFPSKNDLLSNQSTLYLQSDKDYEFGQTLACAYSGTSTRAAPVEISTQIKLSESGTVICTQFKFAGKLQMNAVKLWSEA